MNKLLDLKKKNKILYYVLFPLVIIALIVKFLMDNNVLGAKKSIKKAELKDIDLKAEQEEAQRKAEVMKAEADGHGAKAVATTGGHYR